MLSAVIITHNERRNLARCLTSLEGVTDEVVVVDSGSTDGTQALGESMGARVIHRAWTSSCTRSRRRRIQQRRSGRQRLPRLVN